MSSVAAMTPVGQSLNQAAIAASFDAQPAGLSVRYELLMKLAMRAPDRDPDRLIRAAEAIGGRLGEDGFYSWEVFNRKTQENDVIEGVSIDLVEALREAWGFTAVEARIANLTGDLVLLDAEVFDAKNGNLTARPALFTLSQPPGKFAQDHEQANRWRAMQFQSAVSKAVRGALEHALPAWYVNAGFRAAKKAVEAKLPTGEQLEVALAKSVAGFRATHGVSVEELAEYLRVPRGAWDGRCGMRLGSLWTALEKGQTTVAETFEPIRAALAAKQKPPAESAGGASAAAAPPALPPPSQSAADALGLNAVPVAQAEPVAAKARGRKEAAAAPAAAIVAPPPPQMTPEQSALIERWSRELASVTDLKGFDEVESGGRNALPPELHAAWNELCQKHFTRLRNNQ